jgi:hypothetical protein
MTCLYNNSKEFEPDNPRLPRMPSARCLISGSIKALAVAVFFVAIFFCHQFKPCWVLLRATQPTICPFFARLDGLVSELPFGQHWRFSSLPMRR